MSTTTHQREPGERPLVDKAQYGLAAFLVVVGGYVLYDAVGLENGFADQPVQPYAIPYVVGAVLVVLGVLLAVATARGDLPEAEEGEDIDLTQGTDLRTVGLLAAVLVVNIALIDLLGWAITGALLFAGCAGALGSRTHVRDVAHRRALSVGSWYFFYVVLGDADPRRHPGRSALMDMLLEGFQTALTPENLLFATIGVLLGTAVGVLPGIGPAMALALLLPVDLHRRRGQRDHHVRRHLLRRHVRRLDHLDPAQHPR